MQLVKYKIAGYGLTTKGTWKVKYTKKVFAGSELNPI